jgi:hypothetical protein
MALTCLARPAILMIAVPMIAVALGGCDPRDCILGIAHSDCPGTGLAVFPQDDAICQSYGLQPDTRDYALCRMKKRHERALTTQETDVGPVQNPLTPDVRVVTPAPLPK